MRYHHTCQNGYHQQINKQVLAKMWRKGNSFALLVGMQIGAATVERSIEIPQKIKTGSALWPSNPTFRNISKETQNTNSKEHKHPYVHCSIIYNCQDMEAAQVSISRWVNKTTMEYLQSGILLSYKKRENLTLCNSMDGPTEHYAKWKEPKKDKYQTISLICGIKWTNWTKQAKWDRLRESRMTAKASGILGVEGLSKKEKGLMGMDNSVMIMGRHRV